jgi:Tol biopolymer transport system component
MDDLQRRFRRLDRVSTPNLWNEAVGRAAELDLAPRRAFSPAMGLIAVAMLLAALAGTIAVGGWFNQPAPVREILTYDNGVIVGNLGCELVGIDPASLESRNLVALGDACNVQSFWGTPVWSSDGSRLAYGAFATPGSQDSEAAIWVREAATGETRLLHACPRLGCAEFEISPDGSLIAYVSFVRDGTAELVVAGIDSGEVQRIELTSLPRRARFSPDGSHIALPLFGGRSGVYIIDVRGFEDGHIGSPTLLSGIVDADAVAWSPDGEWVAYSQSGGLGIPADQEPFNGQIGHSGVGIVVARMDGSETRVLATGSAEGGPAYPTWSADSASVAYVTTPTQATGTDRHRLELWTVPIDGGEPTRIYESPWGKDGFGVPEWSPDGEWIAFGLFMEDDPAATGTFLMRPDGSDLRRVSDVMFDPVWQPIPLD